MPRKKTIEIIAAYALMKTSASAGIDHEAYTHSLVMDQVACDSLACDLHTIQ